MIYIYETIPSQAGETPRQFEIKQSIKESALSRHPDTGEPIRRVITGGLGPITKSDGGNGAPQGGGGCARGSCGCH